MSRHVSDLISSNYRFLNYETTEQISMMTKVNKGIQEMSHSLNDDKLSPKLKALIVDDNKFMLQCLKYTLEMNGIQTVEASNGVEALEKSLTETFDIVITDFSMPEMNGSELITELRKSKNENLRKLPVICLSSEESTTNIIPSEFSMYISLKI